MTTRYILNDQAKGLDMEYGKKYKANRRGVITVDNPEHEHFIDNSTGMQLGLMAKQGTVFTDVEEPGKYCTTCKGSRRMFIHWAWQPKCQYCGGTKFIPEGEK